MKQKILFLWMTIVMLTYGCNQDETTSEVGVLSFRVNGSAPRAGRNKSDQNLRLMISMENSDGQMLFENKEFPLIASDQNYQTADVSLPRGVYYITKFIVLADDGVVYTTPREGSVKGAIIKKPLPLQFRLGVGRTEIYPETISPLSGDDPVEYGYDNIDFTNHNEEADWINVRVKFEPTIGGLFYENVDAEFTAIGYDESGLEKWINKFSYTGPLANDLKIRNGFHHYTLEVKKWGIVNKQLFTHASLWERRLIEGSVPVTLVFSGSAPAKKIAYTISYRDSLSEGNRIAVPQSKITYEYSDEGKVKTINTLTYSKSAGGFVGNMRTEFFYSDSRVSRIVSYLNGRTTPYSEDIYEYNADGMASRITSRSFASGITTTAILTYPVADRVMKVSYQFSNGSGFEYEWIGDKGNLKSDKTTRGSQLCSEGMYTYDKGINPLKHLGFVDLLMRNYSIGNRLTEAVNYSGCAFPSIIPESYSYSYDVDGYPSVVTTFYNRQSIQTQMHYFYE